MANMSLSAVALTTTFTPAASCTNLMFSAPVFKVWLNEPMPMASSTLTDCFPSEWLGGYASVSPSSSIAPLMSPLVCPSGWTTATRISTTYVACCPSNYNVHMPDSTVDTNRPAYGGTCFSDITSGQIFTVTQYTDSSVVQTQTLTSTMTSGQAFAHPIDGIMAQAVIQTPAPTRDTSGQTGQVVNTASPTAGIIPDAATPTSPSSSAAAAAGTVTLTTGDIAGIAVGITGAVALIAGLIVFILLRRRAQKPPPPPAKDLYPSNNGSLRGSPASWDVQRSFATPSPAPVSELQTPVYAHAQRQREFQELPGPQEVQYELDSPVERRHDSNTGTLNIGMRRSEAQAGRYAWGGESLSYYEGSFGGSGSRSGSVHRSVRDLQ